MKTYRTIMNGEYVGHRTLAVIKKWEKEAHKMARKIKAKNNPDHIIYAYYVYDKNGEIETAYINILEKTEDEFEKIANLPNYRICAIHKH